ncbi:MAG TPA: AAA family ATPase [Kofleriaceae bacterium]|nr:AAA family ATPase [Kofleriaceae bacterium]
MRIDSVILRKVGPFEDVQIDFPEGSNPDLADVYLLTGPNGCGKTTVLYAIAALLDTSTGPGLLRPRMQRTKDSSASIVVSDQGRSATRTREALDIGTVYDRPTLRPLDVYTRSARMQGNIVGSGKLSWVPFAYAGTRKVESGHVEAIAEPAIDPLANSLSFHNTADTKNLAQWIASQEFLRLKAKDAGRGERAEQIARSVRAIEETIAGIIGDPTFAFVSGSDFDLDIRVRRGGANLDMDVLPDGVKSIVSWIADLLMRLDRIPWEDDTPTLQRSFLLLLDEIDIHLHPAWQRQVIPIVQKLFPKAQIIASTHSPFVVGSADDAHVIMFAMKGGKSAVESVKPSQVGVSYSAVLREIFGIKSEFDVDTERMLADFHAAKTRLLDGTATDRAAIDELARKLAARGEELSSMLGFELRQLERRTELCDTARNPE